MISKKNKILSLKREEFNKDIILYFKKLEEKLDYYKQVVINSNDAIIIQDFKGVIKAWNKAAEKIYGFSEKEMLGSNIYRIISKKEIVKAKRNIEAIKGGKPTFKVSQIRKTKEGKEIIVNITYAPIYEKEEIIEVGTIEEDINELRESEKRYKSLVENSIDYIYLIDSKYKVLSANNSARKVLSKKFKNIIGKRIDELFPKEISRSYIKNLRKVFKTGKPLIVKSSRMIVKNYKTYLTVTLSPIKNLDGKVISVIGVSHDITPEIELEDDLRKSIEKKIQEKTKEIKNIEENYKDLFDNAIDAIFVADIKTRKIINCNKRAEKLIKYPRGEILSMKADELHPKDLVKKTMEDFKNQAKGKIKVSYSEILTKDNKRIPVEINAAKIILKNKNYLQAFFRNINKEKKMESELEDSYKKLKELDIMKDEFLNSVSHELRTPLTPIISQLQRLISKNLSKVEEKESLNMIMRNSIRLDKLINEVIEISHIKSNKLDLVTKKEDIRDIISDTIKMMKSFAEDRKSEIIYLSDKIPKLNLDRDRIYEVLINLIDNAIKFNGGSKITIRTKKIKDEVVFSIKDQGIGISKKDYIYIFKPFFKSNKTYVYKGSGLGLSICKGIIESHNGRIWFDSKLGKGSTFYFSLPINRKIKKKKIITNKEVSNGKYNFSSG